MNTWLKIIWTIIIVFFGFSLVTGRNVVYAEQGTGKLNLKQKVEQQMNASAEKSGLKQKDKEAVDPRIFAVQFLKVFMVAYGIIFVILMILAGYWLLTAQGEEDQIKKAYHTIQGAIIGLFIILSAYSIANFAAKKAIEATNYGGPPVTSQ